MIKKLKFVALCVAVIGFAFALNSCNFFNNEDENSSGGGVRRKMILLLVL